MDQSCVNNGDVLQRSDENNVQLSGLDKSNISYDGSEIDKDKSDETYYSENDSRSRSRENIDTQQIHNVDLLNIKREKPAAKAP